MSSSPRAARVAAVLAGALTIAAAGASFASAPSGLQPAPAATPSHSPGEPQGPKETPRPHPPEHPDDGCPTDRDRGSGNDDRCPPQPPQDLLEVGFGVRKITPVGEPPGPWKEIFHVNEKTGVWGERFVDVDGDGCYDPGLQVDTPPELHGGREPHIDDPWNSAGDAHDHGARNIGGVTIYGDPGSTGRWDGLWANAGFSNTVCPAGAHDDTWARAVVLERGDTTVALVSLDVVGFFNIEIRRARRELAERYPGLPVDELVVSSTHTHEGVDTMGYWGENLGVDGKYPAYQAFVRSQIIDAVHEAYKDRSPAVVKFGSIEHTVGVRDSRDPFVIDPYLLAAQFVREDGSTIGTIVNWSNHPEAQGSGNRWISSDFVHAAREVLEQRLGGIAVYFSGSVGGLMTPLRADVPGFGTDASWERTYEIGRQVALAAEQALSAATPQDPGPLSVRRREFYMDSDNTALRAFNAAGVFDVPTYVGYESWGADPSEHRDGSYSGTAGTGFRTEMVSVSLGPALFLTVPGELFPELELGGYGRSCAGAHTGRPFEPVIQEQFEHPYQFVLGLGQDELGYIVPGYDFWLRHLPDEHSHDGPIPLGGLEAEDPCGEDHYEETVSASSVMAPWVTCVAAELAGRDLWGSHPACSRGNTHTPPYGVGGGPSPGP